jgi:hypothetical protein
LSKIIFKKKGLFVKNLPEFFILGRRGRRRRRRRRRRIRKRRLVAPRPVVTSSHLAKTKKSEL